MFGALCTKINGKAFTMFWKETMIFKLTGDAHAKALALPTSQLFDPMGGRPMKEWVQVTYENHPEWPELAKEAKEYVG